jgi:Spy/CpxP family protein refolding chaperone
VSRRSLVVLLALSAALNLSFLAGFAYVRHQLRGLQTRAGRAEWAARRLDLDERQREAFLRDHERWRSELARVARARQAETDAFWREAVRDDPDRAAVQARLTPLLEAQREATVSGVDQLLRLFRGLTRAQREALAEMLRKNQEP